MNYMDNKARKEAKLYQQNHVLRHSDAAKLLVDISNFLDDINVVHWLVFGTALAAYRDGKFIPWDLDIDIAISFSEKDKLISNIDKLSERNILLVRHIKNSLFTLMKRGGKIPLDIYLFSKGADYYRCSPVQKRSYLIEHEQLDDGFSTIEFCGKQFNIVKYPEKYFTRLYGDWEKPKRNHHAQC